MLDNKIKQMVHKNTARNLNSNKTKILERLCKTLYLNVDIERSRRIDIHPSVRYIVAPARKTIEKYVDTNDNSYVYTGDTNTA